jgi:Coenzyme PQQ synthesis protein D (PqqD)
MLTLSQSARLSKSQDGGILLDLDHGVFFSLNPVGTRIVELLQRASALPSIVQTIVREFHAPEELVKNDVDDFLASLRKQRLVDGDESLGQSASGGE